MSQFKGVSRNGKENPPTTITKQNVSQCSRCPDRDSNPEVPKEKAEEFEAQRCTGWMRGNMQHSVKHAAYHCTKHRTTDS
jgi:hypothetical protein